VKRSIAALVLTLTITSQATLSTYAASQAVTLNTFEGVLKQVEAEYYKPLERDALLQAALKGMLSSLDPYSEYFSASEYKSFTDSIEGSFVGIGVVVSEHPQYIEILQVYPDSPAMAAGLLKGDLITAVNGTDLSTLAYEQRIDRLLGAENTSVTIGLQRGDRKTAKTLVRKRIQVNPVESRLLDQQVGYIRIYEFTSNAPEHFEKALRVLQDQRIKGLILDLRDNPGGDVEAVLKISEWLVPRGTTLITVQYRQGSDSYQSEREPLGLPLTVLVNENSASGSEMLAGIVKDNKTGTVIGTRTFGKGVAQNTYALNGGRSGGFKVTIAEFFTTSKTRIQGAGITPDIVLPQPQPFPEAQMRNLAVIESDGAVKLGASGLNVMAVEQRLALMGYSITTDGVYDPQLYDTLRQMGIDRDGILTKAEALELQKVFNQASQKASEDVQLKKAMEVLASQQR